MIQKRFNARDSSAFQEFTVSLVKGTSIGSYDMQLPLEAAVRKDVDRMIFDLQNRITTKAAEMLPQLAKTEVAV